MVPILKNNRKFVKIAVALFLFCFTAAYAQSSLEVKLNAGHQNVLDKPGDGSTLGAGFPYFGLPDSVDGGYSFGAEFRWRLSESFRAALHVNYDYSYLYQNDVLDEWEWAYWTDTYIDFLPGITPDSLNKILRYESGDGIFSAVFEPRQRLKELRLSASFGFSQPVYGPLDVFTDLELGASIYTRELRMTEHWTKTVQLDSATLVDGEYITEYDFQYDLQHFAPAKKGTRLFIAPSLGLRYRLNESTAIELEQHYVYYFRRELTGKIEDFLQFSGSSEKWFPIYSKYQLTLGIVFYY